MTENAEPLLSSVSTVAEAVAYWLEDKRFEVRPSTLKGYRQMARYIVGPLLIGTKVERTAFGRFLRRASDATLLPLLGRLRIADLTTAGIRQWQRRVSVEVSVDVAARAKKLLGSVLALAEEDFEVDVPRMPKPRSASNVSSHKRTILNPAQVAQLLSAAETDPRGIYYAFPFFTGLRPGEQLGLLWEDVDLAARVIRVRRTLQLDRTLSIWTKSAASVRELPLVPPLDGMLLKWREQCPSHPEFPQFVFPCLGNGSPSYKKRGYPLGYTSYRINYWGRGLARSGLPYVSPHTARHTYISTLQAKGIEIGLVAKLAGHANPSVTVGHYTLPVRGGFEAVSMLADAYRKDWR